MKKGKGPTAYLIHTSGTGILNDRAAGVGVFMPTKYDDIADVKVITSFQLERWHCNVDQIVLISGDSHQKGERLVKPAIICPPIIYGSGGGPVRNRSSQLPELVRTSLIRGKCFTVQGGNNRWKNVHVADLADVYVLLVEHAVADGGKAAWGVERYYFMENGEHVGFSMI
jgi:hypothetical protein